MQHWMSFKEHLLTEFHGKINLNRGILQQYGQALGFEHLYNLMDRSLINEERIDYVDKPAVELNLFSVRNTLKWKISDKVKYTLSLERSTAESTSHWIQRDNRYNTG